MVLGVRGPTWDSTVRPREAALPCKGKTERGEKAGDGGGRHSPTESICKDRSGEGSLSLLPFQPQLGQFIFTNIDCVPAVCQHCAGCQQHLGDPDMSLPSTQSSG